MTQRKTDPLVQLQYDVTELKVRVRSLEAERPGRKPRPLIATKQFDVCALDPKRNSARCPDASIYRYQNGCHGAACRLMQHEAYERRKAARIARARKAAAAAKKVVSKVAPPARKRVIKKTPAKKVAKAS